MTRAINLDIDTGADAIDLRARLLCSPPFARPVHLPPPAPSPIKSLSPESGQVRKLVEEIADELDYLNNGKSERTVRPLPLPPSRMHTPPCSCVSLISLDQPARAKLAWFSLVGLGVPRAFYLRAFSRRK